MTLRLPHSFVGALCLGFALANLARLSPLHALLATVLLGAFGTRGRRESPSLAALASAVVAAAWGWGSLRLAQLDRSVLASRIGTAERAVVEVEEPPRPGMFDQRSGRSSSAGERCGCTSRFCSSSRSVDRRPQGARLGLVGDLRAPPGPSNGFDEAKWLRRQGIHAVLRGQSWRVVGRRGGVSGLGDRVGRWLAGDTTPGLKGGRRDVIEAIVLGRSSDVDQRSARRLSCHRPLPLSRRRRPQGRGGRGRRRGRRPAPRLRELPRAVRCPAHRCGVRARRRAPSVRGTRGTRRRPRLARLARRARAGPLAGAARRRGRAPGLEPVHALRRWVPALVRSRRVDLHRHASRRPGARGLSRVAQARAADRRLDRVRPRDGTRHVVPVPPDLARDRSGERRGGPGRRRGSRPRAPDGRCRADRPVGRGGDGPAQRLGRLVRGGLCPRLREPSRCADHVPPSGRRPRPGSGRRRRLCLAAWRASAS